MRKREQEKDRKKKRSATRRGIVLNFIDSSQWRGLRLVFLAPVKPTPAGGQSELGTWQPNTTPLLSAVSPPNPDGEPSILVIVVVVVVVDAVVVLMLLTSTVAVNIKNRQVAVVVAAAAAAVRDKETGRQRIERPLDLSTQPNSSHLISSHLIATQLISTRAN